MCHKSKSPHTLFFQTGWYGEAVSTAAPGAVLHPRLKAGVEDAQPPGAAVRQAPAGGSRSARPLPGLDRAHHPSGHPEDKEITGNLKMEFVAYPVYILFPSSFSS